MLSTVTGRELSDQAEVRANENWTMGNPLHATILVPLELNEFWEKMRLIIREEIQRNQKQEPGLKKLKMPRSGLANKPLLKMSELCHVLQVSRTTIYEWIKNGTLKPYKIQSRVYFLLDDIQKLLSPPS